MEGKFTLIDTETAERLKLIDLLVSDIKEIKEYIKSKDAIPAPLGDWINKSEAVKLLNKKSTSLYNLRMDGSIVSSKIGKEVYYSLSSIKNYLEKNRK